MDRVRRLAKECQQLKPSNVEEKALVGHFLGALYALEKAHDLGVQDRSGAKLPANYVDELQRLARSIARGSTVPKPWLADFYLNNAVYRLAALDDRLATYLEAAKVPEASHVARDTNFMKHKPAGILAGRRASFRDALSAAEKFGELLRSVIAHG
jgi:hypothetical protein